MNIRKDDNVLVITGKDKGKSGKVRFAYPKDKRVIVEGVNYIKKHSRARGTTRQAGVVELEATIPISNVMLVCNKCSRPTRVGWRTLEDGRKVRVCRSCQEIID
jgi:large subunit ribosomal protein L24